LNRWIVRGATAAAGSSASQPQEPVAPKGQALAQGAHDLATARRELRGDECGVGPERVAIATGVLDCQNQPNWALSGASERVPFRECQSELRLEIQDAPFDFDVEDFLRSVQHEISCPSVFAGLYLDAWSPLRGSHLTK
jgi:hypothetical protein